MRSRLAVSCRLLFLLLALIAALPPSALALTASQVYEQVKDSVVVVKAYDRQGKLKGLGSGVILSSDDIVTNYHVIKAGVRYTVGWGELAAPATLKSGDPDKDLCVLTAPRLVAKPVRVGKTAGLKVGHQVYAVGAPQGLELSLSEGIVSQLRGGPPPLIQTTVAISPGSSGGGLFNAEGELVGITTFYLKEGQSLNFALPVEWIGSIVKGKTGLIPVTEFKVRPIVAVNLGKMCLLGGSVNGQWTDITATARLMQGRESYRLYTLKEYLGAGVGSKPHPQGDSGMGSLLISFLVEISPAPKGRKDQAIIGVAGEWNPLPRTPHFLPTDLQPYKDAATAILKSKGFINPKVKLTQIIRIDLDGDGVEEVLVTATNFADPKASNARNGDYSMVFLQKIFLDGPKNILITGAFHPEAKEAPPEEFRVDAVLDLNGDGIMEIVVGMRYYEGEAKYVFQLKDNALEKIMEYFEGL